MSHLVARLRSRTGTGIDRVDLAFALHFSSEATRGVSVRYRASAPPHTISAAAARRFTRAAQGAWTDRQPRTQALWDWLASPPGDAAKPQAVALPHPGAPDWGRLLLYWSGYFVGHARGAAPTGAVYVNVGFHRFEHPRYFEWLAARPDVDGVFMIHDLLPLDYPEYFSDGEAAKFGARIDTALRFGRAFLVSTDAVRRRLASEIEARGLSPRPIWAHPFPSPLADFAPSPRPSARHPYFVVIGTIEPRKNHLLLLQIWREMARRMVPMPRLVIVGERGWENEQVVDMLERCEAIKPHVAQVTSLGSQDLADLIDGARAVLAPSFEEGYGLPIVEALALGAPVVAAESEAAREVSQGRACLLSPLDGLGWASEIERLATDPACYAARQARARGFVAPNWRDYFASLDEFVAGLRAPQPPVNPAAGV